MKSTCTIERLNLCKVLESTVSGKEFHALMTLLEKNMFPNIRITTFLVQSIWVASGHAQLMILGSTQRNRNRFDSIPALDRRTDGNSIPRVIELILILFATL